MAVVLLCHFDGTSGSTTFTDDVGHTLTPSGVTVTTLTPKFGTGAGDFSSSTTSNITVGGSPSDFNFGAGPFTIEAFAKFTTGTTSASIMAQWATSGNQLSWYLGLVSGTLSFYYSTNGSTVGGPIAGSSGGFGDGNWHHVAVDRDASNVVRVYIDGVVRASATVAAALFSSTTPVMLGNDPRLLYDMTGWLDEVRITVGVAQYGGPFTPPTAPFSLARYVDFAGNLGTPSSYGKLKYGLGHYSRISAFAPTFAGDLTLAPVIYVDFAGSLAPVVSFSADLGKVIVFAGDLVPTVSFGADLDVHVNLIDLAGDIAPQIDLEASLSLLVPLDSLLGSFGFQVVFGAAEMLSGPLWADSEPCPSPPWVPSELCPPSLWTPIEPCDPVTWEKSELCNG